MITTQGKALCFALALGALVGCAKPDSTANAQPTPSTTGTTAKPAPSSSASPSSTDGGADVPLGGGDTPPPGGDSTKDSGTPPIPANDKECVLGGPPPATPGETLVYADEFDGTAVDGAKWNVYDDTAAHVHGTILNSATSDMVRVHDGSLFISTDRAAAGAALPYKGGFIDTLGKFSRTYGKYELRARFPNAKGIWYALWATPATQSFPEIDMEVTNIGTTQVYFVDHWAAPPLPAAQRRAFSVTPTSTTSPGTFDFSAFHTYTMIWKPGFLTLAIDGEVKLTRSVVGVPDIPLVWKLNSWAGGWVGAPDDSTPFPVTYEIDYFRVYRLDGLIADPSIRITNKRSTYKQSEAIDVAIADFDEACVHVDIYDGSARVSRLSAAPYSFSLASLTNGMHTLSFVATDGVRSTIASLDTTIY